MADNFGYVSPFMVSLCVLIINSLVVIFTWNENYGDSTVDLSQTFTGAINVLKNGSFFLEPFDIYQPNKTF